MSSPVLASPTPHQLSFDELGSALRDITFVVVDLETTGGRSDEDGITEIGAVKVRGGEVIGELATLIDPGRGVPPQITELTGITTAILRDAPPIRTVLPSFLEFAAGAVLVAHNAPFDMGFLRAACKRNGMVWPKPRVLCTVRLARRVLSKEEAPSVRLSALAALFATETVPTHRALDDARTTVEVLHRLLERVGNLGVHSYEELVSYLPEVTPAQRRKRSMAEHLPNTARVYLFRGPGEEVLYVGTASDLRRRVRSYFTGSETRSRIREMVALAVRVDSVSCAHPLEAGVRELRLLGAHAPPYNRRSKFRGVCGGSCSPRMRIRDCPWCVRREMAHWVPLLHARRLIGLRRYWPTPPGCARARSGSRCTPPAPPPARCTRWDGVARRVPACSAGICTQSGRRGSRR